MNKTKENQVPVEEAVIVEAPAVVTEKTGAPAAPQLSSVPPPPQIIGNLQIRHYDVLFLVSPQEDITPLESLNLSLMMTHIVIAPQVTWDIIEYIQRNKLERHFKTRDLTVQAPVMEDAPETEVPAE